MGWSAWFGSLLPHFYELFYEFGQKNDALDLTLLNRDNAAIVCLYIFVPKLRFFSCA